MAMFRSTLTTLCFFVCGITYLWCLPLENGNDLEDTEGNETSQDYIIIDQRQNGSENYRINIDGVVIALSPLESLLSGALDDFDFSDEFEISKPSTASPQNSTETNEIALNSNSTESDKNYGKLKRRRHGVSGLMRTIFNQRKHALSKKE